MALSLTYTHTLSPSPSLKSILKKENVLKLIVVMVEQLCE